MHFWIGSRFKGPALCAVCAILLLLSSTTEVDAQTRNWWIVTADRDDLEKGKIQELANRKKVYLNVTLSDTRPNSPVNSTGESDIFDSVKGTISLQKDLRVVTFPEEADFAIIVRLATGQGNGDRGPNFSLLLDTEAEVSIEVIVVVPGRESNGTRAPRIVWEASSPNTQGEAISAARFTVDGFLWELKKVRQKR